MPDRFDEDIRSVRHWLLTISPENFNATDDTGFTVQGLKHKHGRKAGQIQVGDTFTFYLTGEQRIGGMVTITSTVFQAFTRIWNSLTDPDDLYEHRFATVPDLVPPAIKKLPIMVILPNLIFLRKWPVQHWPLALQGQIREIPSEDYRTIRKALLDDDG